ncbi:MAG: efflux RND transporter periplasmic adaptor subunit [Deltaproteobacteria bacterium]|nr:efflux RND transporter periplasmic adaptor subunit [Deltaproteobacteria bacterium]
MRLRARSIARMPVLVFGLLVLAALGGAQWGCDSSNSVDAGSGELALVAAPEARLRVRTERVRRDQLSSGERVTGTVRAFHRATVTAETQGRVLARAVEPGTSVEEGGMLVELESSRQVLDLQRAEASLRVARTKLAHAQREHDRGERLVAESAISEQRRDDLRHALDVARDELALAKVARGTAKRNLEDTRIAAPFAGAVDSISVDVGDYVSPGTPVATVVDLSRVRIFGGVTANEAARLEVGQIAKASFADLGGQSFDATLKRIGRVANPSDGTYEIELWLDNPEERMRDGLVARLDLLDPDRPASLLAPRAALLRREGRSEVFVIREEGGRSVARARPLRAGRSAGAWVEVVEGLEEGDEVVYEGQFALEDGSIVVVDGRSDLAASGAKE